MCDLCNTGLLGDERQTLLECSALAGLKLQFSSLLLSGSGVSRRLLIKDQLKVCRYNVACLDRMSSHGLTLPHPDAIASGQPCWLHFAHITAGLGALKRQLAVLAHLIGSHQWEMPSCAGFSGFAWGLITFQLKRACHLNLPRANRVCNLCNTGV